MPSLVQVNQRVKTNEEQQKITKATKCQQTSPQQSHVQVMSSRSLVAHEGELHEGVWRPGAGTPPGDACVWASCRLPSREETAQMSFPGQGRKESTRNETSYSWEQQNIGEWVYAWDLDLSLTSSSGTQCMTSAVTSLSFHFLTSTLQMYREITSRELE